MLHVVKTGMRPVVLLVYRTQSHSIFLDKITKEPGKKKKESLSASQKINYEFKAPRATIFVQWVFKVLKKREKLCEGIRYDC